jgi:hypothetical protein
VLDKRGIGVCADMRFEAVHRLARPVRSPTGLAILVAR